MKPLTIVLRSADGTRRAIPVSPWSPPFDSAPPAPLLLARVARVGGERPALRRALLASVLGATLAGCDASALRLGLALAALVMLGVLGVGLWLAVLALRLLRQPRPSGTARSVDRLKLVALVLLAASGTARAQSLAAVVAGDVVPVARVAAAVDEIATLLAQVGAVATPPGPSPSPVVSSPASPPAPLSPTAVPPGALDLGRCPPAPDPRADPRTFWTALAGTVGSTVLTPVLTFLLMRATP